MSYNAVVTHVATGIKANVSVMFSPEVESTEAQRDSIYQAFFTRIAGLAGATVENGVKTGTYTVSVTTP